MVAKKYDHRQVEKKWLRTDLTSRRNLPASRSRGAIMRGKQVGYDHRAVEKKWQDLWSKEGLYSPDMSESAKKLYNLWMFPYPSAEGLHAGHAFASTGSDVIGRYMRMNGYSVFQPIGYDSFGIHSENYALKIGDLPAKMIARTSKHYESQLRSLGHGYDWTRTVTTSDPDYYKWTQWLFIQMFKAGLAYKKRAEVNWCPSCKTVLADEQVVTPAQAGKEAKNAQGEVVGRDAGVSDDLRVCERCGTLVERKNLEQWFFKITDYADKLLDGLDGIDWPEKIKTAQRNWIGKSVGAEISFKIYNSKFNIQVFTTRPDTLYGATFLVVSPSYAQKHLLNMISDNSLDVVTKYIDKCLSMSLRADALQSFSQTGEFEKTGVNSGLKAVNPATGLEIPVYISDYVLDEYGTGAIMGVPAHDERDFAFAKKFGLQVVEVIEGGEVKKEAYVDGGNIINSGEWNGYKYPNDYGKIVNYIEKKGWGVGKSQYHLRDWLISRQRYWGPPIPMIFCRSCAENGKSWFTESGKAEIGGSLKGESFQVWDSAGWFPVSETELPVTLPDISDFKPKGMGSGPLADHPEFYETKCPNCGGEAARETDVSDTFLDSAWYFLRYPSVNEKASDLEIASGSDLRFGKPSGLEKSLLARRGNSKLEIPWNREVTRSWLPVDLYFGGAEHAVLHLMYSRFVWKFLSDQKYIDKGTGYEPFPRFFAHGLMIKDGAKMSKSRGNVVNPDRYVEKFGADTLRLYLMFMGPMDGYPDFRDTGIEGMRKFVDKVWQLFRDRNLTHVGDDLKLKIKMHQTIKKVTKDIEEFKYNTAIAAIMEYVNVLKAHILRFKLEYKNDVIANLSLPALSLPNVSKVKQSKNSNTDNLQPATYLQTLALLLAPFTPHLSEEAWQKLNGQMVKLSNGSKSRKQFSNLTIQQFSSVHTQPWPTFDPKLVIESTITIPIQVNGKLRGMVEIDRGKENDKEYVLSISKSDEKVQKWLSDKKIVNEIYVPGRLVNFVIDKS